MDTYTFTHRGVVFTVGPRTPCPGIGWSVAQYDPLTGKRIAPRTSAGAFYDGCDDHPEGAYKWAETACRQWIDDVLARIRDERGVMTFAEWRKAHDVFVQPYEGALQVFHTPVCDVDADAKWDLWHLSDYAVSACMSGPSVILVARSEITTTGQEG